MTVATRELLARTGRRHTRLTDDPGHISDRWRNEIIWLCDLIDNLPTDVAEQLAVERREHQQTRDQASVMIGRLRRELAAAEGEAAGGRDTVARLEARLASAVGLVEDALPRMRTLNNVMSPGWLGRADELLGD